MTPFTFHVYVGLGPPFRGVAVNVTESPEHTPPGGFAVIETPTGVGMTVTTIPFDEAGFPVPQGRFEFRIQYTESPLAG